LSGKGREKRKRRGVGKIHHGRKNEGEKLQNLWKGGVERPIVVSRRGRKKTVLTLRKKDRGGGQCQERRTKAPGEARGRSSESKENGKISTRAKKKKGEGKPGTADGSGSERGKEEKEAFPGCRRGETPRCRTVPA